MNYVRGSRGRSPSRAACHSFVASLSEFYIGLFDGPLIRFAGGGEAMSGEESSAVFPEKRPDHFTVRGGNWKLVESGAGVECERTFAMRRWKRVQFGCDFEKEH